VKYRDFLKQCIQNKGLSHREISRKCKESGTPVSQAYISQLVKGEVPPPSEEITKILARVIECDPEKLIWLGYIEKAPEPVRPVIQWYIDHFEDYCKIVASLLVNRKNLSQDEIIDEENKVYSTINSMSPEDKIDFVINRYNRIAMAQSESLREFWGKNGMDIKQIDNIFNSIQYMPINRIKIFDPENADIKYDWINTEKIGFGDYMYILVQDDSMINANITKGAKVLCELLPNVEERIKADEENRAPNIKIAEGKIYFLSINENYMFRRIYSSDNDKLILQAGNPHYPPITISDTDEMDIIGYAKSVEINLND